MKKTLYNMFRLYIKNTKTSKVEHHLEYGFVGQVMKANPLYVF